MAEQAIARDGLQPRKNGAGLTSSSRFSSLRKRVENNLQGRTTYWPSASKPATVHHVAGQPGPVHKRRD